MATSVVTAAYTDDHQTTNPIGAPQDHHHHTVRRSSGRRKSKGSESSSTATSAAAQKNKKQRQRGMGVEKLERLILQDTWKNLTEINPHSATFMNINAFISPPLQTNHAAFHGGEPVSALNCFSQHCDACHKKKKADSENLGSSQNHCRLLGLNHKKQGFGKGVEVVAVHRRGSEGGGVVLEYEFIPPSSSSSSSSKASDLCSENDHEDLMMMVMKQGGGSSSSSSMGGFDASKCIDLSLKLSY